MLWTLTWRTARETVRAYHELRYAGDWVALSANIAPTSYSAWEERLWSGPKLPRGGGMPDKRVDAEERVDVEELVNASGLIFAGTVVERGASTVPAVSPNDSLLVVRLDRGLRIDPRLGDLTGKAITVRASTPESLQPGQAAVFFTNSWVHGRGIAVREVAHVDIAEESDVAAAVDAVPTRHLRDLLQAADLVASARVTSVTSVEPASGERNSAAWAAATLKIDTVLRGEPAASAIVYFPTSDHPLWARAPRFKTRQHGIFLLYAPRRDRTLSEASLESSGFIALDPADFQPESRLAEVKKLLRTIK